MKPFQFRNKHFPERLLEVSKKLRRFFFIFVKESIVEEKETIKLSFCIYLLTEWKDIFFSGPFRYVNILDKNSIEEAVVNNNIDTLIHFSALLSAVGENNVPLAIQVNGRGVENVLEVAKAHKLKLFIPSTIGAFGPTTQRDGTPDLTIQRPRTIYGVTKVYAELLGEYYFEKYGVDFRSLRFPGIISTVEPGGGTTDYAIKIYYDALLTGKHTCYLKPDTELPMMYDTDCMTSVIQVRFKYILNWIEELRML